MNTSTRWKWLCGALSMALTGVFAFHALSKTARPSPKTHSPQARALTRATQTFLNSLEPDQRARLSLPFDSDERFSWHYVPMNRRGISWKELSQPQKTAAEKLLRVALSASGAIKAQNIRLLEPILFDLENQNPIRDADLYYFTVFGTPDADKAWALRYEGHHISLHWTVLDGRVIADSPQFLGANPARVQSGPKAGLRVLAREEDLGRALLLSLDAVQRQFAITNEHAPNDILTGNTRRAAIEKNEGISYQNMNPQQRAMLMQLITEYAQAQPLSLAKKRLHRIEHAGIENIKFAWMGSLAPERGHYYRVQGPTFLIEYDNTQNNANHIHTVWRDFQNDFGADVLGEHLSSPHSHHAH